MAEKATYVLVFPPPQIHNSPTVPFPTGPGRLPGVGDPRAGDPVEEESQNQPRLGLLGV